MNNEIYILNPISENKHVSKIVNVVKFNEKYRKIKRETFFFLLTTYQIYVYP